MDRLLQAVLAAGARMASPGEFSERAFLNDKLDLAQAEAIADLIDSATEDAARSALISLSGQFSTEVFELVESITRIRVFIEAALDFSDEDIDFLADDALLHSLEQSQQQLQRIVQRADSGRLLREGATVVIAGKPNAGKSSLLNYLTGHEAAIVTDMPGTTRDILKEHINLDGIPVHLLDTAGLRQSDHRVEQEGIRRANQAIASADLVLLVVDSTEIHPGEDLLTLWQRIGISAPPSKWCVVFNKTDLSGLSSGFINDSAVAISTKYAEGMSDLKKMITSSLGFSTDIKNPILARRRHLDALRRAQDHLNSAISQLKQSFAGELVAEDLKECQKTLGEITGTVYSDELLGRIFSSFCIGK
jgi:tRNA modification GTPase